MNQDELIELLKRHEWRDIEFKEAKRAVPKNAYDTVSAFANTEGGHLVFGIKKDGEIFEVVGVLDVDKVQNEFLSALRNKEKISVILNVKEDLQKLDDGDILIFYVPEASRSQKPVYLRKNPHLSYVRRGGCDVKCSEEERNRFLVDAAAERYDGRSVDLDINTAFDPESLKWYRTAYENRKENRSYATFSDLDFLAEMELLVERRGKQLPSSAAILLFGTNACFRQFLPRPVVDCQRYSQKREQADHGERWIDRLVQDSNLIQTWKSLVDWYQKSAERPFRIDPTSMQRDDTPPDYRAFREAMVNLLIHQDYSDHSRKAEIRYYSDQTVFWNPGDAFATEADLLEPGEKEVRNPRIVTAFRRIGLSENAGWGLRDIYRSWQKLGHVPPVISNDKGRKSFELVLRKEELLSEQQILLQGSLGVELSDEQARTFALACRSKEITLSEIKAVTGLTGSDALALAETLVTQVLLKPVEPRKRYALVDHLREHFAMMDQRSETSLTMASDLVTGQVEHKPSDLSTRQVTDTETDLKTALTRPLKELTETHWRIVEFCDVPRRLTEIMEHIGVTGRGYFKEKHVNPLIQGGVLAMTNPDNPRASNQRYVITKTGAELKARRLAERGDSRG